METWLGLCMDLLVRKLTELPLCLSCLGKILLEMLLLVEDEYCGLF